MERYLNPELYIEALEGLEMPDAQYFIELVVKAESSIFVEAIEINQELLDLAWYMYSIAAQSTGVEKYGLAKVQSALRISAHVFDLASRQYGLSDNAKMIYIFASQFSYIMLGQDPFSIALYKRTSKRALNLSSDLFVIPTEMGCSLLAMDVKAIYANSERIRTQYASLSADPTVGNLKSTPLYIALCISEACKCLIDFLVYGNDSSITKSISFIKECREPIPGHTLIQAKWVAGVIEKIINQYLKSSLWKLLSSEAGRRIIPAFSLIPPRILTLWPPQLDILKEHDFISGFAHNQGNDRLFLSTPTSSGKTLLSQLIIALYLEESFKKVIYVAPTRALCKEVSESLQRRMQYLRKKAQSNLPDFELELSFLSHDFVVEIMTPERLHAMLRADTNAVILETGLFVFDEVHNIEDDGRGATYEECITIINKQSKLRSCKIILISAVAKDEAKFLSWIGGRSISQTSTNDWQGSRRVKGVYFTKIDRAKKYNTSSVNISGWVALKINASSTPTEFLISDNVGVLAFKSDGKRDTAHSTAKYKTQIPLIRHLSKSGSLLIIAPTKILVASMAREISEDFPDKDSKVLDEFIFNAQSRLGTQHQLLSVLKKGIAYHHGALPIDVREGIERLIRSGDLNILVSTTTVIEGVNLSVRSILVSAQGTYTDKDTYQEFVVGKSLLNAIGRAGRATKETEGIIILAVDEKYNPKLLDKLSPDDQSLSVNSSLLSEAVFKSWDDLDKNAEEAIFKTTNVNLEALMSLIWYGLSENSEKDKQPEDAAIELLNSTYGWQSLSHENTKKITEIVKFTAIQYLKTPQSKRRFIAKGGGFSSSYKLYDLARSILHQNLVTLNDPSLDGIISVLLSDDNIKKYFLLPQAPKSKFWSSSSGKGRIELDVNFADMTALWLDGYEIHEIAVNLFDSQIKNKTFMIDQLVDFIYRAYEVYLPAIISKCIDAMTSISEAEELDITISKEVCNYLRWGVKTKTAIEAVYSGIQMRSLATKLANKYDSLSIDSSFLQWLKSMDISEWRENFNCSASEVRALIFACKSETPESLQAFLLKGGTKYNVKPIGIKSMKRSLANIDMDLQSDFFEIPIIVDGEPVAMVPVEFITEVEEIIASGIPCRMFYERQDNESQLFITPYD